MSASLVGSEMCIRDRTILIVSTQKTFKYCHGYTLSLIHI
ncbi:hypothetical protein JMUB7542_27960 [Staphylococcus aureus]